jgi:hypothetical protein
MVKGFDDVLEFIQHDYDKLTLSLPATTSWLRERLTAGSQERSGPEERLPAVAFAISSSSAATGFPAFRSS